MKIKDLKKELHAQIERVENRELLLNLFTLLKENIKGGKYGEHLSQQQQDELFAAYKESDEEENLVAKEDFTKLNAGSGEVQTTKLELIQLIIKIEEKAILEKMKSLLNKESEDWWDDLSDDEKKEIELGLKDVENGNVVDHEEVKKLFRK